MQLLAPKLLTFLILLLAPPAFAAQVCLKSRCFPEKTVAGSHEVTLVGAAHFRYFLFEVYTAAFYTSVPSYESITATASSDSLRYPSSSRAILSREEIFAADVPKLLEIEYHREIARLDIIEAAEAKLQEQLSEAELKPLLSRLALLNEAYRGVREGDRYVLSYTPETGTSLVLNDEELISIPGSDFAAAYFGIWLHPEKPIDKELRYGLLKSRS